jgi:hypothetical protein
VTPYLERPYKRHDEYAYPGPASQVPEVPVSDDNRSSGSCGLGLVKDSLDNIAGEKAMITSNMIRDACVKHWGKFHDDMVVVVIRDGKDLDLEAEKLTFFQTNYNMIRDDLLASFKHDEVDEFLKCDFALLHQADLDADYAIYEDIACANAPPRRLRFKGFHVNMCVSV